MYQYSTSKCQRLSSRTACLGSTVVLQVGFQALEVRYWDNGSSSSIVGLPFEKIARHVVHTILRHLFVIKVYEGIANIVFGGRVNWKVKEVETSRETQLIKLLHQSLAVICIWNISEHQGGHGFGLRFLELLLEVGFFGHQFMALPKAAKSRPLPFRGQLLRIFRISWIGWVLLLFPILLPLELSLPFIRSFSTKGPRHLCVPCKPPGVIHVVRLQWPIIWGFLTLAFWKRKLTKSSFETRGSFVCWFFSDPFSFYLWVLWVIWVFHRLNWFISSVDLLLFGSFRQFCPPRFFIILLHSVITLGMGLLTLGLPGFLSKRPGLPGIPWPTPLIIWISLPFVPWLLGPSAWHYTLGKVQFEAPKRPIFWHQNLKPKWLQSWLKGCRVGMMWGIANLQHTLLQCPHTFLHKMTKHISWIAHGGTSEFVLDLVPMMPDRVPSRSHRDQHPGWKQKVHATKVAKNETVIKSTWAISASWCFMMQYNSDHCIPTPWLGGTLYVTYIFGTRGTSNM